MGIWIRDLWWLTLTLMNWSIAAVFDDDVKFDGHDVADNLSLFVSVRMCYPSKEIVYLYEKSITIRTRYHGLIVFVVRSSWM
jgi:hypothetical protein